VTSSTRPLRGLLALALPIAAGCGPESTTARIAALEPFDPEDCDYEQCTNDAGERFVEHPLFGCVRAADLVRVTYDLTPGSDGRPRTGLVYGNGNGTQYTLRSVVGGFGVGSTFPATHEVRHGMFDFNGAAVVVTIPELDDRVRGGTPPLDQRECVGMCGASE
jgi:hypothetical protein